MYYLRLLGVFSLMCLGLLACKGEDTYFVINGQIENMPDLLITLEEDAFTDVKVIDTVHADAKGKFQLKGVFREPGLYKLHMNNVTIPIIIDQQKITLKADWKTISENNFEIEGSPATNALKSFNTNLNLHFEQLSKSKLTVDSLVQVSANDSIINVQQSDFEDKRKELISFIKEYADTSNSLPLAYYAAFYLRPSDETAYFKAFSEKLLSRFPDSYMAKVLKNAIDENLKEELSKGLQVGQKAPDFTLPDVNGASVTLNSLLGKYILIDFWASWCPPCRAENPNVVKAFDQFKDKNFTILGVSLDNNREKWIEAIETDQLNWLQLSDLKHWKSSVVESYNLQAIPANVLIDPAGVIIAKDLRGEELIRELAKVLN